MNTFVVVACTSDKRWFDLDAVRTEPTQHLADAKGNNTKGGDAGSFRFAERVNSNPAGAPPLDWWEDDWQPLHRLPTQPYKGTHYAAYPVALPRRLIEAMCPLAVCQSCNTPYGATNDREELRRMPSHVPGGSQADEVLREAVRGAPHSTAPLVDSRLRHVGEGLQVVEGAGSSDGESRGLRHGAPSGNGGTPRAVADCGRGGAPHQRAQGGQPDREPRADAEGDPRSAPEARANPARVSALRRVDPNASQCPACGGDLRPGRVFDSFGGSGTTAVAAAQAGRDCILIDLDRRNVDLCRRRLAETMLIVNETVDGDVTTWTVRHDMPGTRGETTGQQSLFEEAG